MRTFWMIDGNAGVAVSVDADNGMVWARLYVNVRGGTHDAVSTLTAWKGKTEAGARRWATKVLNRHNGK